MHSSDEQYWGWLKACLGGSKNRNQGVAGVIRLPTNFFTSLENCVGHTLKLLDIVQKIWATLRKLFPPPGFLSWLRAWRFVVVNTKFEIDFAPFKLELGGA